MMGASGPQSLSKKMVTVESKAEARLDPELNQNPTPNPYEDPTRSSMRSSIGSVKILPEQSLMVYNRDESKTRDFVPPSSPKFLEMTRRIGFPSPLKVDQSGIPLIRKLGVKASVEALGKKFDCNEFQTNHLQFWFLDVTADCLWRAQDEFRFDSTQQEVILEWFIFVFELIADPQLDLDRSCLMRLFSEALRMAEEHIRAGSRTVPLPNTIFLVPRPNHEDAASIHSVQSFSTSSSSLDESDQSHGSYLGAPGGRLFRIPCGNGGPDLEDECLSSSVSTLSEEEEEQKYPTMSTLEEVPPPTESLSFDDEEFYKPDMRTPPRFKELKSEDSTSIEISSESASKGQNASSEQLDNTESNKWYEIPRRAAKPICPTLNVGARFESKSNILDENDLPINEKDILKAFYDYNFWQLRKEMMADEKQGWVSTSEQSVSQSDKEVQEKKAEFRENLVKYIQDGKKQFERQNEQIFVNYCVLLAIKQFIFEYLLESFPFSLIKKAYRYPHYFLTQGITQEWNIPKQFKRDFKKPVPKKQKKAKKEKPKKEKKPKEKKSKTSSKKSEDSKKSKKSKDKDSKKSDKKSKKDIKEEKERQKQLQKQQKEDEMKRKKEEQEKEDELRRAQENKMYMFPLEDAVEDSFFEGIFEDWKPSKKGKDKSEKASDKGKQSDKSSEKKNKKKK